MKYGKNDQFILAMLADGVPDVNGAELVEVEIPSSALIVAQRGMLEENPAYRQIIPYVMFRCGDLIAGYRRMPAGGEARLHGKVSVGFGGHVDLADVERVEGQPSVIDLAATLKQCLERELEEEVDIGTQQGQVDSSDLRRIVANTTPVDCVHIGVPTYLDLDEQVLASREEDLEIMGFKTPEQWLSEDHEFETWTEVVLKGLRG